MRHLFVSSCCCTRLEDLLYSASEISMPMLKMCVLLVCWLGVVISVVVTDLNTYRRIITVLGRRLQTLALEVILRARAYTHVS